MRIVELDEDAAPAWCALVEACGSGCFCRWWHFEGSRNEWLLRCASAPELSRAEQLASIRRRSEDARGLVALGDDGTALGWLKLAPRRVLRKLVSQGPYRRLRLADEEEVLVIACLLVDPRHRRQRLARALVDAALRTASAAGAKAVEAYPRGGDDRELHDEEAWLGTVRLYAQCGFAYVAGEASYPVMRREIAQPTTSPADANRPSRTS